MDDLRWILLIAGVALIGGIYFLGRRGRGERDESLLDAAHDVNVPDTSARTPRPAQDPDELDGLTEQLEQLTDLLADPPSARTRRARQRKQAPGAQPVADTPEKIVAIHLAAPHGSRFSGTDLARVFEARGYRFGEHDIYHSVHEGRTVFSVVNMVKPGSFDPDAMAGFETPGISLFLQLPGPLAATVAFDILVAEANALSQILGGSLQDASHSTLTPQTVQHLREEVLEFSRLRGRASRDDG